MIEKTIINVIDQDRTRAIALVSELSADTDVEVTVYTPGEWNSGPADAANVSAAFVGHSSEIDATDQLLDRINEASPGLPVVVFGFDGVWERRSAVETSRILETLQHPVSPIKLNEVMSRIKKKTLAAAPKTTRKNNLFRSLVGKSASIQKVQRLIDHVANTDSTVLITGESGTGKEVVARNIHYRSSRRDGPFVPINCAAIPDDLFESELFGHEKGAFTGALSKRTGRFELANKGTLFLDEIGDMPLATQTKMLRVIQERVFERLGSNKSIETNVRIIAATHCDLDRRIDDKRFRKDLYYRLNVFPIEMPSLRHRSEDIPLLVEELRQRMKHELGLDVDFARDAMRCLAENRWDGNVRQLANAIERIAILFPGGKVSAIELPKDLRPDGNKGCHTGVELGGTTENIGAGMNLQLPPEGLDLKHQLGDIERMFINLALKASEGVVSRAAEMLNIGRTTLVEKIRRYDIDNVNDAEDAKGKTALQS